MKTELEPIENQVEGRDSNMCFACGKANPIGLHLDFEEQGNSYKTVFIPGANHQGYPGLMHGGLTGTILDEIMGRYLYVKGIIAPTAELTVRYKKPVPIGQPITVTGQIISHKGRLTKMTSQLVLMDGTVAAEAEGKFVEVKNRQVFKQV